MQRLCNFSMHALFFLARGSSRQKLPRVRAKDHVCLCSNHSNAFSTIEVILPIMFSLTSKSSHIQTQHGGLLIPKAAYEEEAAEEVRHRLLRFVHHR